MSRDREFLTPDEAAAVAADVSSESHWAAPFACWCGLSHAPGAAGTVPPPLENELPAAFLPGAAGSGVPARASLRGPARAPASPGDVLPPQASPGVVIPVPHSPGGTGADGDAQVEAEPPARPAPGSGPSRRNPGGALPEPPRSGGEAALSPDPVDPPSDGGRAAPGTLPGTRSQTDVPGGGFTGGDFRARWREALSAKAKGQRRQRGKHRAEPGYKPGMNRRAQE